MRQNLLGFLACFALLGCYDGHDVALNALESDGGDINFDDAAVDSGTDASEPGCVASECPTTGFGAACCTDQGTCGIDATAFGLGCFDVGSLGGGGGLPQGFFGGGATPD